MKHIITIIKKCILAILILILNQSFAISQNRNLSINSIYFNPAKGNRLLTFRIPMRMPNNTHKVYVYYSTNQSQLTETNIRVNQGSYGRAILYGARNNVASTECHFVFPHQSERHPVKKYFQKVGQRAAPSGYNIRSGNFLRSSDNQNNQSSVDIRPRVYKKTCVYYRVLYKLDNENFDHISPIQSVYIDDEFSVAVAGDSYGSGEGTGDWTLESCHRSEKAGLIVGLKYYMENNPQFAFDYTHVACSGAKIEDFYHSHQGVPNSGILGFRNEGTQFTLIQNWLLSKEHENLNMLIMNIGGNDAGFGDIVLNYHMGPGNFSLDPIAQNAVTSDINALPTKYLALESVITSRFGDCITLISTLPNPLKSKDGDQCGTNNQHDEWKYDYECLSNRATRLFEYTISSPPSEFIDIENIVLTPLNNQIKNAANRNGWHIIDVENRAPNNGVCVCANDGGYFWIFPTSTRAEGSDFLKFTMHPNETGYVNIYRDLVYQNIKNRYDNFLAAHLLLLHNQQNSCPVQGIPQLMDTRFITTKMPPKYRNLYFQNKNNKKPDFTNSKFDFIEGNIIKRKRPAYSPKKFPPTAMEKLVKTPAFKAKVERDKKLYQAEIAKSKTTKKPKPKTPTKKK